MKAFTTITPAFESFCEDCLVESLHRSNPGVPLEIATGETPEAEGNADFRSIGFDGHAANKMSLIATLAQEKRQTFLIADTDVIYFKPVAEALETLMGPETDILIARDDMSVNSFNIGQIFIRPSRLALLL